MDSLGKKIKNLRLKNNLSQLELANILCVSDKTISSWENDRTMPDINFVFKLADIFHTSFYSLAHKDYCNTNNIELEIKLKVDLKEWNRVLDIIKSNSIDLGVQTHFATYFYPIFRNFQNEYLRIRNENGKYILNYKNNFMNNCCNEYETLIDNIDNLEKILSCLNFKKIGNINKVRKSYLYKEKYEVSFDNVDNIGTFIEIEVKNITSDYENEYNNLINILKDLKIDLNLIVNKRYPDYLVGDIND